MLEGFPKEKIGQKVINSPSKYPHGRAGHHYGPFPTVGMAGEQVPWLVLEDGWVYDPFDIYGSIPKEGELIDIARRTRALVAFLRNFGVEDITHSDIQAECEDEWNNDYAIVCDAYTPWGDGVDSGYFDDDQCIYDFKEAVTDFFSSDSSVRVIFHNLQYGSNEIEIIRG